MPAETPEREPGQVTISVEREEYAPGDTVSFSVTVAARGALKARALVVDLFGVEEVEPFDDEEEGDDFLFGLADEEEEETSDENVLTLSVNGEGVSEAEDDEDEDEDEDDWDEEEEEDALASFTYEDEAVLATDLSFKANETRTFNGSFVIPEDAQPSYFGIRATHTWWLDAYLDGDVNVGGGKEILIR